MGKALVWCWRLKYLPICPSVLAVLFQELPIAGLVAQCSPGLIMLSCFVETPSIPIVHASSPHNLFVSRQDDRIIECSSYNMPGSKGFLLDVHGQGAQVRYNASIRPFNEDCAKCTWEHQHEFMHTCVQIDKRVCAHIQNIGGQASSQVI